MSSRAADEPTCRRVALLQRPAGAGARSTSSWWCVLVLLGGCDPGQQHAWPTWRGWASPAGFGFLDRPAGFDIGQSLIDYSASSTFGRAFLVGLLNTLLVAVVGIVLATILGFIDGHRPAVAQLAGRHAWPRSTSRPSATSRCCSSSCWSTPSSSTPCRSRARAASLFGLVLLNNGGLYPAAAVPQPGFGVVRRGLAAGPGWRSRSCCAGPRASAS